MSTEPSRPERRTRRWATGSVVSVAAMALLAGSCGGGAGEPSSAAGREQRATASAIPAVAWERPPCRRPVAGPPRSAMRGASASEGVVVASDHDVFSFDGTQIRVHWFPHPSATADRPAATVLLGPGWGQPGDADVVTPGMLGLLSIGQLRDAGFNVLTWDPRGFGESSGRAEVNSPEVEARDVSVLLDWIVAQPGVRLDATGDPRAGMAGPSYGGGIQNVTAATDCRVDALVPIMSWHSLTTSLFKGGIGKAGWGNLLVGISGTDGVADEVVEATRQMNERGAVDPVLVDWFAARGPAERMDDVDVPTLFVQGTVDTLFTLQEAVENFDAVQRRGVPAAMLWFCGGHGTCLTNEDDGARVNDAAIAWLRRWVLDDAAAPDVAVFDVVDQAGNRYRSDAYPVADGDPLVGRGSGTLELLADGGSGPVVDPPPASGFDLLRSMVLGFMPARATNAVDIDVPAPDRPRLVVGAPTVRLTYAGTAPEDRRPTVVFAQVVDETTGLTLGNQVTPVPVVLDGEEHTTEVPLEIVVHAVDPSSRLLVQLVATTVAYATPRLGGRIEVRSMEVSLPVAADLTPPAT